MITADGAADILMDAGRVPEIICTNLEGNSEADIKKEVQACEWGSIVIMHINISTIHTHDDNIDKLEK